MKKPGSGFTLLEVAVVTALLGAMSYLLLPSLSHSIESSRIEAEDTILMALAGDIERSFSLPDPNRNISNLPGHLLLPGSTPTRFDGSSERGSTVIGTEWFAKVASIRGGTFTSGASLSQEEQTGVYQLAWNGLGRPRLLLAGPEEAGQQRYLLVSLVAPASRGLSVPSLNDASGQFNAIWNHDWESPNAGLPPEWLRVMDASDVANWNSGAGGASLTKLLRVRRIVQPKHRIIVNNTHATNRLWVDAQGVSAVFTSEPGSGVTVSGEFLAGRRISIRRGTTAPGLEVLRFHLHEESSVTVQP